MRDRKSIEALISSRQKLNQNQRSMVQDAFNSPQVGQIHDNIDHRNRQQGTQQDRSFIMNMLAKATKPVADVWNQREVTAERQPEGHVNMYDARGEYMPKKTEVEKQYDERASVSDRFQAIKNVAGEIADGFRGAVPGQQTASVSDAVAQEPAPQIEPEVKPIKDVRSRIKQGLFYAENRGRSEAEAYTKKSDIAHKDGTHDWGKYQVNENTMREWSKVWLGKEYSPKEWVKDPQAQEKFLDNFLDVVDNYNLDEEEAAMIWHKGWGVLGTDKTKAEKGRELSAYIDGLREEMDNDPNSYLQTFNAGIKYANQAN